MVLAGSSRESPLLLIFLVCGQRFGIRDLTLDPERKDGSDTIGLGLEGVGIEGGGVVGDV